MREPFRLHVERRRQHQDMRVRGLLQMRHAIFRHHEGAAGIDTHHQVEPLHVGCLRIGQADSAGIVDGDIDAAEFGDGLVDRCDHLGFSRMSQITAMPAAGGADLVGGGVDRTLEFRMRLRRLRRDRDVGAVRAARNAIASPMPRLPPDTNRVLPLRDDMARLRKLRTHNRWLPPPQGGGTDRCAYGILRQSPIGSSLLPALRAAGARIGGAEQAVGRHRDRLGRGLAERLDHRWPLARNSSSVSAENPRSTRTSSGIH